MTLGWPRDSTQARCRRTVDRKIQRARHSSAVLIWRCRDTEWLVFTYKNLPYTEGQHNRSISIDGRLYLKSTNCLLTWLLITNPSPLPSCHSYPHISLVSISVIITITLHCHKNQTSFPPLTPAISQLHYVVISWRSVKHDYSCWWVNG